MVAYDVLRNCAECPPVDTLFTLGSPLGIQEVQDELVAAGRATVNFPSTTLRRWVNVYDPLDPVCSADPILSNDYAQAAGRSVEDVKERIGEAGGTRLPTTSPGRPSGRGLPRPSASSSHEVGGRRDHRRASPEGRAS